MKSYEVIHKAVDRVGVKTVAATMNLSGSLIYKWCQRAQEGETGDASGAINPLDRLEALWECTHDPALIDWICQRAGGTFVPDPTSGMDVNSEYVQRTQQMIQDFSELLGSMSESIADDGKIDRREAAHIREEWQKLKQHAESFVIACEKGRFSGKK